jgi:hypothetical protein
MSDEHNNVFIPSEATAAGTAQESGMAMSVALADIAVPPDRLRERACSLPRSHSRSI